MTAASQTRRQVMLNAWAKYRYERSMGRAFTFSAALVHAWAWIKGAAARVASAAAWAAQPAKRLLRLSPSLTRSPTARALTGQRYAGQRAFKSAYTTARVGY